MKVGLLKQKDFSLLMMGKFISLVGTQMQSFALSLYVYKKTGSAAMFASVIVAALIPQILLSPIAGVFADWLDRKKVIVYLDVLSGLVVSGFALEYFFTKELTLPSVYAIAILLTLISVLYQPALGTVIPTIIKKDDLIDANTINSFIMNIGNFLSPLIAGVLFGFYGIFVILIINAVSFFVASIGESCINIPKTNKMPQKISFKAFRTDFSEGVKVIKSNKIISSIILLAPILNCIFSSLFSVGIVCITKKILKVSDFQYSMVEASFVVAMIIAPLVTSNYVKKHSLGKILYQDVFATAILIAVMAIVPTNTFLSLFNSNVIPFATLIAIILIIGIIMTTANIALSSLFQKSVPLEMMGRVGTVMNTCCMCCIPIGQVVFGFMFDGLSAWICVLICAVILLVSILGFRNSLLRYEEVSSSEIPSSPQLDMN